MDPPWRDLRGRPLVAVKSRCDLSFPSVLAIFEGVTHASLREHSIRLLRIVILTSWAPDVTRSPGRS